MMSKIVVVALLCATVAQIRGESIEYDIRRAMYRLEDRARGVERRVDGAFENVRSKQSGLETKANFFLEKECRMEDQIKQNVQRVAELTEQKATEEKKPPAVFECISKAEKQTLAKIDEFGPKFEVDIRRMERTKSASIEVAARPLETIDQSLEARFDRAAKEIQSSRTPTDVRKALARAMRDYDLLYSEIRRVEEQVSTAFNQFMRDATNLFRNYARQAERIQAEGLGAIRRCMYTRNIFEQQ